MSQVETNIMKLHSESKKIYEIWNNEKREHGTM